MSHDGDELEDDSLRAMRTVWLSMRDEEPSARGMGDLLAAARARVVTRQEPTWRRALAALGELLRRPPVLALATIVVVAGAAALVASHGGMKAADAPVATPAAAPVATPAPMMLDEKRAEAPGTGAAAAPVVVPAPAPPPAHTVMLNQAPRAVKPVAPPAMSKSTQKQIDDLDTAANSLAGSPPSGAADDGHPTATFGAASAPEPKAQHSVQPDAPTPHTLALQCQAAASRGDCASVRALLELLRTKDAALYRTAIRDSTIGTCL